MFECTVTEDLGVHWINLQGRIDGMSTPEIGRQIEELALGGDRILVVNFEGVHYISSAGLRVFLMAQKNLKKAGGELILYKMSPGVLEVFEMSGLHQVFTILSSAEEVESALGSEKPQPEVVAVEIDGISIQCVETDTTPGSFVLLGPQDKLATAQYSAEDVVAVKPPDIRFGAGMAVVGDQWEDYRNLFGESVIIDHNIFFYPAVKRPAVDFMLYTGRESSLEYKFLNGFGFSGECKYVLSFKGMDSHVELSGLVNALFSVSDANILGLVFFAESKGLWGMHLKKVPITDNAPSGGKDIFDQENFSEWMNFPVEPVDINNIIAGAGIAVKDKALLSPQAASLFSKDSNFHIHAGVFEKEPLNKNPGQLDNELKRVLTELDVLKVQHILGKTRLSSGMLGIIELQTPG